MISTHMKVPGFEHVPEEHYVAAEVLDLMADAIVASIRGCAAGTSSRHAQPSVRARPLRLGYLGESPRTGLVRLPRWLIPVNY